MVLFSAVRTHEDLLVSVGAEELGMWLWMCLLRSQFSLPFEAQTLAVLGLCQGRCLHLPSRKPPGPHHGQACSSEVCLLHTYPSGGYTQVTAHLSFFMVQKQSCQVMRKCFSCPPDACGCPLTILALHPDLVLILFGFHATRPEVLYFLFSLPPAVQTFHISSSAPCTLPSPACLHTQLTTVPPHEHGMLYGTNICQAPPLPQSQTCSVLFFLFLSNQCFSSLMENFQCHQHFAASLPASGFSSLRGSVDTLLEEIALSSSSEIPACLFPSE